MAVLGSDNLSHTTDFKFNINSADRVTIDSSGRLLVGTSTAYAGTGGITELVQVNGACAVRAYSANQFGNRIQFTKSRNETTGSHTVVESGDFLGFLEWAGSDGTDFDLAARITAEVDGTPGANNMPGRLVFSTTASGASSPTERLRINNAGRVFINGTTEYALTTVSFPGAFTFGLALQNSDAGAAGQISLRFMRNVSDVGSITTTNTATAYNTTSDYRLKENVVLLTGAIDRLQQIPVHRFNFIADPDTVVDGFLAHEAQEVVPECVTGTKDETQLVSAVVAKDGILLAERVTESEWESGKVEDDEGNSRFPADSQWVDEYEVPVYQGIDQSKIVPLLTAALQEAIAKIEILEAKVEQLEAI